MSLNQPEKHLIPEDSQIKIREELDRVLASDRFSRSNVLSSFLKFIVEETLAGNVDSLKEYTIAVSALGKPEDFNPQTDAIIRIHAGRLRRMLNEYYRQPEIIDTLKIELVKGTYVPVFRKHLINKTKINDDIVGKAAETLQEKAKEIPKNSPVEFSRTKLTLAVLPFRNLYQNGDYQFFVDGFGEEITRLLSTFEHIDVIAHHSTRKYADHPEDIRVIGSDLGVHYIISGSVKRSIDNIRINVALLKTLNGVQIWSQTYNYPLNIDNLINIQDQIVENVCSVLGGYYGIIIHDNSMANRHNPANIDAFDATFWNYYFHMNYSETSYLKTREALENAVRLDPNFALGLAMLAELYVLAQSLGYPTVNEPLKVALDLTKRALSIDPQSQHVNHEYGWLNVYLQNKKEAVKALEYALSLNPTSVSLMGGVGFNLACAGEYERAEVLLTKSLDLNPHCPWWFYFGFFLIYYKREDYDKALEYANNIETVDVFLDPLTKAVAKAQLGKLEEAQKDVQLLNMNYSENIRTLYSTLDAFLLDKNLIDEIIEGAKKAGLCIP